MNVQFQGTSVSNMSDNRPRICVLGSINMDLVVRADRLPAPGQTLLGGPFATYPGGKGANQAVAAARLGGQVRMVGAVGDDEYGRRMLMTLNAEKVDTTGVRIVSEVPTGVAVITVDANGENTIVVAPGANGLVRPEDADSARETIRWADVLLMQLETPVESVARAAAIAVDERTTVVLNAAPARELGREFASAVDVLVVNQLEAAIVAAPSPGPEDMCLERLGFLGFSTAIMTLGEDGAAYVHAKRKGTTPAYEVNPVDTVGAGDAFVGSLAVRWAHHKAGAGEVNETAMVDIVSWACAAGALATTEHGAIPSLPRRDAVVELLRSASARIRVDS